MTQLPPPMQPIQYAAYDQQNLADNSHLNLLSIFHFVWGGLALLGSCIFILYIVLGIAALNSNAPVGSSGGPSPNHFGWIFIILGAGLLLVGWTIGLLNVLSGLGMRKRKWRILSLMMAGMNCLSVPLGTTLGVFTFIVLLRPSVTAQYAAAGYGQR